MALRAALVRGPSAHRSSAINRERRTRAHRRRGRDCPGSRRAVDLQIVASAFLPGLAQASIDWQIIAAVTALAILTGLAAGLAPALSASQIALTETMKTGSQRSTSGFWASARGLIIAGEVAATLVLLVSAGLLLAEPLQTF